MAAVIKRAALFAVERNAAPARGLYGGNILTLARGHKLRADICICRTAAAEGVKLAVMLESLFRLLFGLREKRDIPVDGDKVLAREFGYIGSGRPLLP